MIQTKVDVLSYRDNEVIERYAEKKELPISVANLHWAELMKFLFVCATDKTHSHSPSKIVDEVWHVFIIYTKNYHLFCKNMLGTFIHHVPSKKGETKNYLYTIDVLEKNFKIVDNTIWPSSISNDSVCSGCGSDTGNCTSCNDDD